VLSHIHISTPKFVIISINMLASPSLVCVVVCLTTLPLALATILTTTATAGTAVTIGLAATTLTTAQATALAAVGTGAAAVVGALAAGSLLASHHRYKRDTSSENTCTNFDNEELIFILAANTDQLGCGQRLVCELEASPDNDLSSVETSILELFGRNVKPLKASQMANPKSLYHYAAQVGSKAANIVECAEVFDLCPLDRVAIMQAYSKFAGANAIDA